MEVKEPCDVNHTHHLRNQTAENLPLPVLIPPQADSKERNKATEGTVSQVVERKHSKASVIEAESYVRAQQNNLVQQELFHANEEESSNRVTIPAEKSQELIPLQ